MNRIKPVKQEEASEEVKELFTALESKMGKVINIFATMAHSPAALKAFLALNESMEKTSLPAPLREKIALAVGQKTNCHYCLSAHTAIAKGLGIDEGAIAKARSSQSDDPKTAAILKFAQEVAAKQGNISDAAFEELKKQGVSDKEIVEVILATALNLFTNYFNLVAKTEIDFPKA